MSKWQNRLNNMTRCLKRMKSVYKYRALIEERKKENEPKTNKETF